VSCTYSLQHCFLLHNKTENDKRILCSCKIFGWECVGDSIPVKPTIPYLHVASFQTFHFVNLIFQTFAASLHLLCHWKFSKQREGLKTEPIEYCRASRGKHDVAVILDNLRYQHSCFLFIWFLRKCCLNLPLKLAM
jgi:hypothetical protein